MNGLGGGGVPAPGRMGRALGGGEGVEEKGPHSRRAAQGQHRPVSWRCAAVQGRASPRNGQMWELPATAREPTPDGQSLTHEAPSCLNKKYPGGASGKEPACQSTKLKRRGFDPWVRKIPWMRTRQATPVFLPGESPWTEEPGRLQSVGSQRGGDGGSGPKVGLVTRRSPFRRNPLRLRVPSGEGLRLVALVFLLSLLRMRALQCL